MNKHMIGSMNEILSTRSRAVFNYRINFDNIKLGNVKKMNDWCEEKCQGIWRSETYHALYFQFELEQDATMFMLRWGTAEGNKLK